MPVAIATSFLLIVVVAFMWWIIARTDRRRDSAKKDHVGKQVGIDEKEESENHGVDDIPLPKYEASDKVELPPYERPKPMQDEDKELQNVCNRDQSAA